MTGLRDSRLAVTASTVLCIAVGLSIEWGVRVHPSTVIADELRLVPAPAPALASSTPSTGVRTTPPGGAGRTASPAEPATTGPGRGSASASGGGGRSAGTSGTAGVTDAGAANRGSAAGASGGRNTGAPAGTGGSPTGRPPAPSCGSPHTARGFRVSFVYPCENSVVPLYPWPVIRVSAYPAARDGALAFLQTVLTDRDGPIRERPVFGLVSGGISAATNLGTTPHLWTHDVRVGTPCRHDRGRTVLGIYLLTPAGVREAERTWVGGQAITRLPAGTALLDEVTVSRRDNTPCGSEPPSQGTTPPATTPPEEPSATPPAATTPPAAPATPVPPSATPGRR